MYNNSRYTTEEGNRVELFTEIREIPDASGDHYATGCITKRCWLLD